MNYLSFHLLSHCVFCFRWGYAGHFLTQIYLSHCSFAFSFWFIMIRLIRRGFVLGARSHIGYWGVHPLHCPAVCNSIISLLAVAYNLSLSSFSPNLHTGWLANYISWPYDLAYAYSFRPLPCCVSFCSINFSYSTCLQPIRGPVLAATNPYSHRHL